MDFAIGKIKYIIPKYCSTCFAFALIENTQRRKNKYLPTCYDNLATPAITILTYYARVCSF